MDSTSAYCPIATISAFHSATLTYTQLPSMIPRLVPSLADLGTRLGVLEAQVLQHGERERSRGSGGGAFELGSYLKTRMTVDKTIILKCNMVNRFEYFLERLSIRESGQIIALVDIVETYSMVP